MPTFTITLRSKDDSDSIRSLRWVLKRLLRQHQMRCVSVQETNVTESPTNTTQHSSAVRWRIPMR